MQNALLAPALLNKEIKMEFNFTLTEEEANIVLNVLQELPAKIANPLTKKLMEQAQAQAATQRQQEEVVKAEVVNDE
jgi:hypothetical protein